MASASPLPIIANLLRPRRSLAPCLCLCPNTNAPRKSASSSRHFSTSLSCRGQSAYRVPTQPRWLKTPPSMVAPVSLRTAKPNNNYPINEDPERLDLIYVRILGEGGDRLLTEEVKWLAVTHKSFDQGRRGFNDRLAFLGKRIVDLQASLALLNRGAQEKPQDLVDQFGRERFQHPALDGIVDVNDTTKADLLEKKKVAQLADKYGLLGVLRWRPRFADDLYKSGMHATLAQALYAIVGAISLQKGGDMANRIARERIVARLMTS